VRVARKAIGIARSHPQTRACRITVSAPDELPIQADPVWLQRALLNLLVNAGEATEGCGCIEVRIARRDGAIHLEVHDDGPGIPLSEREAVLEAFHSTKPDGAGIGLFSVRLTAEGHGGHVELHDSDMGGACVRMVLPSDGEPS